MGATDAVRRTGPRGWWPGLCALLIASLVAAVGAGSRGASATDGTEPPPTIPNSAIVFVSFYWFPGDIKILLNDRRHDGRTEVTCNGVASEEIPTGGTQEVILPAARTLDIACEMATGETFRYAIPALERWGESGWNFDRNEDSKAVIDQCRLRGVDETASANVAYVWPTYLLDLDCPSEVGEFSFDPPEQPVGVEVYLRVCPPGDDAICAPLFDDN